MSFLLQSIKVKIRPEKIFMSVLFSLTRLKAKTWGDFQDRQRRRRKIWLEPAEYVLITRNRVKQHGMRKMISSSICSKVFLYHHIIYLRGKYMILFKKICYMFMFSSNITCFEKWMPQGVFIGFICLFTYLVDSSSSILPQLVLPLELGGKK